MMKPGPVWHGAAIGWHNSLNSYVTTLQSNSERFSGIKLCTGKSSVIAVSLYSPTHGKDDEFLECLSLLTEFLIANVSAGDSLIIGADTNCSSKSTSRRRKAWKTFLDQFCLSSQPNHNPTFHHHNGQSESSIDAIFFSKHLDPSTLIQLCTLEHPANLSSHDVLTTSVSILFPEKSESKYEHTYSAFNRECIVWEQCKIPEYEAFSAKALNDALKFWSTPECIPLLCSLFSNLLVKSAKLVFEVRKSKKKLDKPVSKKIRAAENDLKRAHKLWKRSGKPVDKSDRLWQRYTKARSYLQIVSRHEDNKTNIKLNNTLIHATAHDKDKVYSMLRSLRNEPTKNQQIFLKLLLVSFMERMSWRDLLLTLNTSVGPRTTTTTLTTSSTICAFWTTCSFLTLKVRKQ